MNIYLNFYRGSLDKAIELFNKAINLSRTEDEMAHLYSLLDAAMAQARVAQFLGIQMPTMMEAWPTVGKNWIPIDSQSWTVHILAHKSF